MFSIEVNFVKPTFKNVSMLGNDAVEGVTFTFCMYVLAGMTQTQAMTTTQPCIHEHMYKHAHTHSRTRSFCSTYGHLCVVGGVAGSDASPTCVGQQVQHLFVFFCFWYFVFSIFALVTRSNTLVSGHQEKGEIFTSLNSPICSTRFFTQASFSPLGTLSKAI